MATHSVTRRAGSTSDLPPAESKYPSNVLSQKIAPTTSFSSFSIGQMIAETTWESWK